MAPEVLDGSILHRDWTASFKQADRYGLGLLFWELSRRCHDIVKVGKSLLLLLSLLCYIIVASL